MKEVKYIGGKHQVLVNGETYKVQSQVIGGVIVYIETGFCGIPTADFEVIK